MFLTSIVRPATTPSRLSDKNQLDRCLHTSARRFDTVRAHQCLCRCRRPRKNPHCLIKVRSPAAIALGGILHLRNQPNLQTVPPTSLMHPHVAHNRWWTRLPHRRPSRRSLLTQMPGSGTSSHPRSSPSMKLVCVLGPEFGYRPSRLSSSSRFPRIAGVQHPSKTTTFQHD